MIAALRRRDRALQYSPLAIAIAKQQCNTVLVLASPADASSVLLDASSGEQRAATIDYGRKTTPGALPAFELTSRESAQVYLII